MFFTDEEVQELRPTLVASLEEFGLDMHKAEDQVQECFYRAWKSISEGKTRLDQIESPRNWLLSTAKHCAIDLLRKELRLRAQRPGALVEFNSASLELHGEEGMSSYDRAVWHEWLSSIENVDGQLAHAIRMIAEFGYSLQDTAEELQITVKSLRQRLLDVVAERR